MTGAATISDVDFLQLQKLDRTNYLYVYRSGSGLFRKAVRERIVRQAEQEGRRLRDIAKSTIGHPIQAIGYAEAGVPARGVGILSLQPSTRSLNANGSWEGNEAKIGVLLATIGTAALTPCASCSKATLAR